MSQSSGKFDSSWSGGVRHTPEADIMAIRDLLRGYNSLHSIVKELIQNAEDAEASRMHIVLVPGDPEAPHALLKGPGLLAANNGVFREEHREAISRINYGTKGTEERAIGRFGKGLKSVFALCEAFFIIARTDRLLGWPADEITDFFNPWHGWRHLNWTEEFQGHGESIHQRAEATLKPFYGAGEPWLGFWFPLRQRVQGTDSRGQVPWIFEGSKGVLPGDDPSLFSSLCSEFKSLGPSLVILRHLKSISIVDGSSQGEEAVRWEFAEDRQPIPGPEMAPAVTPVRGRATMREAGVGPQTFTYSGLVGRLADSKVAYLKEANDWPKVVGILRDESDAGCKAKGEPHYATLITAGESNGKAPQGKLDLQWCVFFPVGKQPSGLSHVPLSAISKYITINLHGFFFLDSERLRIDGLDEQFEKNGASDNKSCLEWNRIVATEGTLARLPEALAAFAADASLDYRQCTELSDAIRRTSVWNSFGPAVCSRMAWRPRWRAAGEVWECMSAGTPVYTIPGFPEPHRILTNVPRLRDLGEKAVLATRRTSGDFPGLHDGTLGRWPESLVLELLGDLSLSGPGGDETAAWLNEFLTHLHTTGALTSAVRERISNLPLLQAHVGRTNALIRLSPRDWRASVSAHCLFAAPDQKPDWLSLLRGALPEWSHYIVSDYGIPRWFDDPEPPRCSGPTAARIVLSDLRLGDFRSRANLVRELDAVWRARRDPETRLAMRYLMHEEPTHARDGSECLFMPPTVAGEQVWSRMIEQVLGASEEDESWRHLDPEWASVLNQQTLRELNVATTDAAGVLRELSSGSVDSAVFSFDAGEWSVQDVSALLKGLFEAGQWQPWETLALLRRLRVHTLRGHPESRVSVDDGRGSLGDAFVLDTPGFDDAVPAELRALWQRFLSETKVVERIPSDELAATVQEHLFRKDEANGVLSRAILDWNYVVRRCLESLDPCERAALILEALRHGDQVVRGLGQKLKTTPWLPLDLGGGIRPDSVLYIEGLEEDLLRLLDPSEDGLAGVLSLPEWVRTHPGFATLRNYLPRLDQALDALGLWLDEKPDWQLGLTTVARMVDLELILGHLSGLGSFPAASLLMKLRAVRSRGQEREIDSLIEKHVLPAVLKPFDYRQGGVERIGTLLKALEGNTSRPAFDAYLAQACRDDVIAPILPNLSLVNKLNDWVPARQLIWPSTNLSPAAQLCTEQAAILERLHHGPLESGAQLEDQPFEPCRRPRGDLVEAPDFEAEIDKLAEYIRPFRNSNVGENLVAAFVAVLGGHPRNEELLRDLLKRGIGQRPEDFLVLLFGESDRRVRLGSNIRFLIEIVKGSSAEATTITGQRTTVPFTDEVDTLIVGDPTDLWWSYMFRGDDCRFLRLRWIENPDELADPVVVFARTIETILLKVYYNGSASRCPANLRDVLEDVAEAGQADLRRSQAYLMDMAEARLIELSVKDVPVLDEILKKFAEARDVRVDADLLAERAAGRAKQRRNESEGLVSSARTKLIALVEAPELNDAQLALVNAVRRKMSDFEYGLWSVALELFQNADDAVAELDEMRGSLHPKERNFRLSFDSNLNTLEVTHWGRPINQHESPGFEDGQKRGYHRDLQKMLTLNFSDKGIQQDDGLTVVTGRFGLGFKSVFFVSEQPEVISGRLAFAVRGGFYPASLHPSIAEELRNAARQLGGSEVIPTAVRLRWTEPERAEEVANAVLDFETSASLLTVFSRRITTIAVSRDGIDTSWSSSEQPLTDNGSVTHCRVGTQAFLCFRCALPHDEVPATVVFGLDPTGLSSMHESLAGLWITVPTAERSDLLWALNAPFKPDAGRQRLPLDRDENKAIAQDVARAWGDALIALYDALHESWDKLAAVLEFHRNVSFSAFWSQLWKETTRIPPVKRWDRLKTAGQLLSWVAWADPVGAMRQLSLKRPCVPTRLPGVYSDLAAARDVRYYVGGILGELANGGFAHIARWDSTRLAYPPGQVVHQDVETFLSGADLVEGAERLTLQKVLTSEIGPQLHVEQDVADKLGRLLSDLESSFDARAGHALELEDLRTWFKKHKFLAEDEHYHYANELVCRRECAKVIGSDEIRRAGFAVNSAVLLSKYSDDALVLFDKARGQLLARATTLAEWARSASGARLTAVFEYIADGELDEELADQLGRSWFEEKSNTPEWRALATETQYEVRRKFAKGLGWLPPMPPGPPLDEVLPPEQVLDAEDAFRLISQWWQAEHRDCITWYESKTYPPGFPSALPWPGEDAWESGGHPSPQTSWLLLFIHAALVPLGFNNIGRDQSFSRFLVDGNWLHVLSQVSTDPHALLEALDRYLDKFVQDTEFHFQMRQFLAFYAVARNLEALLLSLREADRSSDPGAFRVALAPKAFSELRGTGIEAPPLTRMLGMGSCQLLRELYRLGRLSNPLGYQFAFTPIRKVRRLCVQLFGVFDGGPSVGASMGIFGVLQRLGELTGFDPTFNRCFDLPLQILAQDASLRTRVLHVTFEAEATDDETLDAAPTAEEDL